MQKTLNISECFYSIQGEGVSVGIPSYFIRLANCNLNCGVTHDTLQKIRKLVKEGKDSYSQEIIDSMTPKDNATWVCDSIPVWVKNSNKLDSFLLSEWRKEDIMYDIFFGNIHLIWTGGEPLMKVNQKVITDFLMNFKLLHPLSTLYNEIETNGTQYIEDELFDLIQQINCSVKLKNSGHSKEERIVPDALYRIKEHKNHWFKFVVSNEDDIREIFSDFKNPFDIKNENIILMPALSKQSDFHEKTKFVFEMAKKWKVRATQRMHISAWDCVTGV